jgi:protein transport protein SEC31
MFDEEARKYLLAYFGFSTLDLEKPEEQEEENPLSVELANLGLTENSAPVEELKPAPVISVDDDTLEGPDDGEGFFDRLETPMASTETIVSSLTTDDLEESAKANTEAVTTDSGSEMTEDEGDNETDEAIRRALVAGDFKGAVDICLGTGRVADALVMAAVGGSALWEKTQQEYFRRTKRPYLKVPSLL